MNSKKVKKLHQIYRRIPNVNCKGLCTDSCSILGMSVGEAQELQKATGEQPLITDKGVCNYLKDGRCSVYNIRPTICRIFGAADDMPCPFGCAPAKPLPSAQANTMLREIRELGGGDYYNATPEQIDKLNERIALQNAILPKV